MKDAHRNGSSLLTNGHTKAEHHTHKKLRADWPRGETLRAFHPMHRMMLLRGVFIFLSRIVSFLRWKEAIATSSQVGASAARRALSPAPGNEVL